MLIPLIRFQSGGSPDQVGLLISAILPIILLGFTGTIYSGQLRCITVDNIDNKTPLVVERVVPRIIMVSHGARLKEGKAIKIKIKAGVIVQINSIVVPWFKYL